MAGLAHRVLLSCIAGLTCFYFLLVTAAEWAFLAGAIWPALAPHFLQNRSLLPSSRNRATQAGRRAARCADVFQVRELDRHVLFQHAALRILLAAADVFLDAIDAFDNRLARRAINLDHAALAGPCRCPR